MSPVLLKKILDNLKSEIKLQNHLLELLTLERSEIVYLKSEELNKLREKKEELIVSIDLNKDQRLKVLDEISPNIQKDKITLTKVFEAAPAVLQDNFKVLSEELKKTLKTVQKLHQENSSLLKQSLSLVSSTVSILSAKSVVSNQNYQKDGKVEGEAENLSNLGQSGTSISSFNRSA